MLGPSLPVVIGVISFFAWSGIARVVRGQTISLRQRDYIEAARSLGAGPLRIMFTEILPNLIGPVLVLATLSIPSAIIFEATLSFLGLGVQPPTASWGNILAGAQNYYSVAWWYLVFPALALLITTLAFNILGDGIRDALDPGTERLLARRGRRGRRRRRPRQAAPPGAHASSSPGPPADHRPLRRCPGPPAGHRGKSDAAERLSGTRPCPQRPSPQAAAGSRPYDPGPHGPRSRPLNRSPGARRSHGCPGSPGPCAAGRTVLAFAVRRTAVRRRRAVGGHAWARSCCSSPARRSRSPGPWRARSRPRRNCARSPGSSG